MKNLYEDVLEEFVNVSYRSKRVYQWGELTVRSKFENIELNDSDLLKFDSKLFEKDVYVAIEYKFCPSCRKSKSKSSEFYKNGQSYRSVCIECYKTVPRERGEKLRNDRASRGICYYCDEKVEEGYRKCKIHLDRQKVYNRRYSDKRKIK